MDDTTINLKDLIPDNIKDLLVDNFIYTLNQDNNGRSTITIDGDKLSEILVPDVSIGRNTLTIDVKPSKITYDKITKLTFQEYKKP